MIRRHESLILGLCLAIGACTASNDDAGTRMTGGSSTTAGAAGAGTSTGQAGSPGAAGSGSSTGAAGSGGNGGATAGAAGSSSAGAGGGSAGTGGASMGGAGGSSGGAGGSAGAGGSVGPDAGGGGSSAVDGGGLPPLIPCTDPSVSRLKVWEMDVMGGTMVPPSGSPLRKVGNDYEMHVVFTLTGGGAYGTANAPLKNMGQYTNGINPAQYAVDVSGATGITLEYSTTGNSYLQLRTGTVPHGGDHFRADMPVTGDQLKTITLNFANFRRPGGTTPPGADVLKDLFSLTFVAGATTTMTLRQVRIAGFTPPCN